MRNKNLQLIRAKIESIGYGLLRSGEGIEKETWQVSTSLDEGPLLNCILPGNTGEEKLLNRKVSLVQKNEQDYVYVSGKIDREIKNGDNTISLRIIKACWFTRKKMGNAAWLQEKCIYESTGSNTKRAS